MQTTRASRSWREKRCSEARAFACTTSADEPEWFGPLIQHKSVGLGLLLNVQVERNIPSLHAARPEITTRNPPFQRRRALTLQVLARLKRAGVEISQEDIVGEFVLTPTEWRDKYGLYRGASFGLSHCMTQLVALRPANRDPRIKNLYFVGASTSPGRFVSA